MERNQDAFELSDLFVDSLCLNSIIAPHTKFQCQPKGSNAIEELLKEDPAHTLGFNKIGKPRIIPESEIGTTIQEFYRGLNVFLTGGSGFLGKALIEKLIRSIPHLGKVYLLMRAKKGVPAKDRLEKLLENEVFLRMKTEVPNFQSKLIVVEGDISEPNLGLSDADCQMLQRQVHVVIHSAADVRFVNTLRSAVNSNLIGSQRVMELARGMKSLKSYVHVSTAYSNCVRKVIEEKTYKLNISYKDILKLLDEKSDSEIDADESRILQGWPNTYTFSKALCEDMLSEECSDLPLCIFRPAIIGPSWQEPLRVWTDNIYGPTGMLMAVAMGVLHIKRMDLTLPVDIIPVDLTVNAVIAVTWENATERTSPLPVYNFSTTHRQPLRWKRMKYIAEYYLHTYPFELAIWYPFHLNPPNKFLEEVGEYLIHKIPGHIFDRIAVALGQEPRLTKVYNKLLLLRDKLAYFIFKSWEFSNDNTMRVMNKLSEEDKKIFPFDILMVNMDEYFLLCKLGVKYFYLKESLQKMPQAAKKHYWLKVLHYTLLTGLSFASLKMLVTVARVLPI